MDTKEGTPSRRKLFEAAGLAVGAAVAAEALALGSSEAQPGIGTHENHFWTAEYWARKGEVNLYLYRKRAKAPTEKFRVLSRAVLRAIVT